MPVLCGVFMFMIGRTTGQYTLSILMTSGAISLMLGYIVQVFYIFSHSFNDSMLSELIEIVMISCCCMFQTVFKFGENVDDDELIKPLPTNGGGRYDVIDEILNTLANEEETFKFDIEC